MGPHRKFRMRHFWTITALVTCSVVLSAAVASGQLPSWVEGTWTGIGYQEKTKTSWSIRFVATADAGQGSYKIEYPSLSCGGYWTLVKSEGDVLQFVEHITYGKQRCIDGGTVTIGMLKWDQLRYHWRGNGDFAGATLIRHKE